MKNDTSQAANWSSDFKSSIVVFLISLPLGLGIAMASGVPPAAGIVSSVIGGILVGFFSGVPLLVSGAAAGLAVTVYEIVGEAGLPGLAGATLIAGLLQVLGGFARLGRFATKVSPHVIHGMLAGIGALIFLSQMHVLMGHTSGSSAFGNILKLPMTLESVLSFRNDGRFAITGVLGIMAVSGLIMWPKVAKKLSSIVPGALVVTVLLAVVAMWFPSVEKVVIPARVEEMIMWQGGNLWALISSSTIIYFGIKLALIASIESMLCATAVAQMRPDPKNNFDKELAAQGLGNMICGLVTALPLTGVIVRSAANVHAGALTRKSTIMHGAWVVIMVLLFSSALEMVPLCTLAAILLVTAWKLLNLRQFALLARTDQWGLSVAVTTFSVVVFVDLLLGVVAGIFSAILVSTIRSQIKTTKVLVPILNFFYSRFRRE